MDRVRRTGDAARFPGPDADQGVHTLRYALVVGGEPGDAVREGRHLNLPERVVRGTAVVAPLVGLDDEGVVVSAVELADGGSGDVVVRLYEARGRRVSALLTPSFAVCSAVAADLLERPLPADGSHEVAGSGVRLRLRPFRIVTLRLAVRRP